MFGARAAAMDLDCIPPDQVRVDSVYRPLLDRGVEAAVEPAWSMNTRPECVYLERCYERTYLYLQRTMAVQDIAALVHGVAWSDEQSEWLRHAWVELPGEVIFCGVLQRFYTSESFHDLLRVDEHARHTWREAWRLSEAVTDRRYTAGPWHSCDGPCRTLNEAF
jgi:hypothetical protein